jgi:hypothetical protein
LCRSGLAETSIELLDTAVEILARLDAREAQPHSIERQRATSGYWQP